MSLQTVPFFECTVAPDIIDESYTSIDWFFGPHDKMTTNDFHEKLRPENWGNLPRLAFSLWSGDYTTGSSSLSLLWRPKWPDFIKSSLVPPRFGMVISKQAQDLLQQFRLPQHRWIPIKIVGKQQQGKQREQRPYAILNFGDWATNIDFPNSALYDRIEKIPLHFDSFADWRELLQQSPGYRLIGFTRLALSMPLDLLYILSDSTVIVSERLKNAIEESSLVGFKFEPMTRMEVMMKE